MTSPWPFVGGIFALASALLIVLLLAGFSIGMIYQVNLETRLLATDLENNQAI